MYISVKWFGAKGDGVTDDTAAIAAAIAKAAASSINGGVVEFPEGTFNHTGIVAVSNVILKGAGSDKTKLSYVGTGSAVSKGAVVTSIFRFGMRDIAVVQDTDGQGGTGLDLDSFQYADFYNVTVSTFRNAGDTGIGVRMVNTHAVCAHNRFVDCTIANCDTALLQDSTNATFATGFSYFAGLTIEQEHDCIQLKSTLANGGSYNVFSGLQIQGNGAGAGTGKVIYIEGVGNAFYGVQVDGPGLVGNILEFNKATTSGNIVAFIGGFDPTKYVNNQASGAANQVMIPGYFSYSPGKKFRISDPLGQLDINFSSAGSNGLDIQLGNATAGETEWRLQMQPSATPYLRLGTAAGVINEWKFTYHKFFASAIERMRMVAGGLVIEPGIVSNDPDASAALEVRSISKGTLLTPMTYAQRNAIATPANGLMIMQSDGTAGLKLRVAGAWVTVNVTADP